MTEKTLNENCIEERPQKSSSVTQSQAQPQPQQQLNMMPGIVRTVYETPEDNFYHMVIGSDDDA
jgi:hypothetical protein